MRVILTSEAPNKTSNIIVLWQCCSFLLSTVISHQLKFLGHFQAWGRMNPLTSVRCMSSHMGEDPQGGRILFQPGSGMYRPQKAFLRGWHRVHCPRPSQLETTYSRLLFGQSMPMTMLFWDHARKRPALFNTNIVKPGFKCDRSSVMKSSSKWLRPLCESSAGFFTLFLLSCKRPREATAQESSAHWVSVRPNTSSTTGSL